MHTYYLLFSKELMMIRIKSAGGFQIEVKSRRPVVGHELWGSFISNSGATSGDEDMTLGHY
jgi:hypothetical protein